MAFFLHEQLEYDLADGCFAQNLAHNFQWCNGDLFFLHEQSAHVFFWFVVDQMISKVRGLFCQTFQVCTFLQLSQIEINNQDKIKTILQSKSMASKMFPAYVN